LFVEVPGKPGNRATIFPAMMKYVKTGLVRKKWLLDNGPLKSVKMDLQTAQATEKAGKIGAAYAMYQAVAAKQGVAKERIAGTIQNDLLKEFGARGAWIFPIAPSMRLVVDAIQYCTENLPRFNPISIASHFRDAGATPAEEAAYTLSDGVAYVKACIDRGMKIDAFAPRLSFFFYTYVNFFEEIAKYRAARTLWAQAMRERFGARDERSWKLRFHSQTAGVSLTAQQPYNNVVRTALQALSAVLGGTNSLHTNSLDEALALPTAEAATLALRTQQIIAHESGVVNVVDPLGGSYFVEKLTKDMEDGALAYFRTIDAMGGMVDAIERGFPQQEIAESSYRFQQAFERKEKIMVGVNAFVQQDEPPIEILYIDESASDTQLAKLEALRKSRNQDAVTRSLDALRAAAGTRENLMPRILDAVRAYATVGEMCDALRDVWGEYEEVPII